MADRRENIHSAASKGSTDVLRCLLQEDTDIDARNSNWETALYSASAGGKLDAVRLLINSGAKVNARARKRFTPLHAAARFGHLEVLNELIDSGAGLERATIRQMTPLALAARYGQAECARVLLQRGASLSGSGGDMFGRTPLHWAIKSGHDEIVNLLLEAGADVNAVDNFEKTPILQAVKSNRPAVLRQLICINGADVTRANRMYREPIHTAAERGHRRCLGILLEHGCAANASILPDRVTSAEQMKTALMIAASHGRPGTIKFLLDHGADANRQDAHGLTALDHVTNGRMFAVNSTSRRWRRSAVALVRHGNVDPCLLSDWPCSWNVEDNAGAAVLRNALEMAFRAGFDDLVRVAAVAGAPPRGVARLFRTRTADLPNHAAKATVTLDWLRRYFRSPRPLKELARRVVRTAVGTPYFERKLGQLGLAPGLLKFLMFPELDEAGGLALEDEASDDDGSVDEEGDNEDNENESDTESEMEPSVFDSDLYGDAEPFVSDDNGDV